MKTISHIVFFLFISTTVLAQSYNNLWKQYRQYADKDLPKSALTVLDKIKAKAEKENSYGNLLAVLLREVNHQEEISTDSGKVFRERLDQRIASSGDGVIKTLYRVAKGDRIDIDSLLSSPDSAIYRQKDASLQWLPFFEKGKDSKIFNNDLLHVILLSQYSDEKIDSIYGPANEYVRYNRIHNEQVRTEPYFTASIPKRTVSSATDILIRFSQIRNLMALECEVSRVDGRGKKEEGRRKFTLTLPAHEPTKVFSDSLRIGTLPVGRWVVRITDAERKTRSQQDTVTVSDTRILQLSLPKKQKRYVYVNAITGEETDPDTTLIDRHHWNTYSYNSNKGYKQYTDIYTDRAIYRPGQKIEAAIIRSSVTDGIETSVVAGEKLQIKLLDSKGEAVAEKYAVTDAYGTAAVDFTLPDGDIRSGYWRLSTKGADASFRVEEYKRPTFKVTLTQPDKEFTEGDTAIITGTAMTYTGLPLQNCRVLASYNNHTDTLFTDPTGHFQIPVIIRSALPLGSSKNRKLSTVNRKQLIAWWRYVRVTAEVTDLKGETQGAQCYLNIRPNLQPETPEKPKAEKRDDTTLYHIYYNVFAGDKVLESSKTYADTASFKNSFTYKEEYGDGAMICFAWCKDDEIHYDNLVVRRPLPSNKLQIEWGTFRDHLAPGSKETWTLKIHPETGLRACSPEHLRSARNGKLSTVNSQLMAVLYDSSLDGIRKHTWPTHDRRHLAIPVSSWFTPNYGGLWIHGSAKDWVKWRNFDFTHINGECMLSRYHFFRGRNLPMLMATNAMDSNAKSMRLGALPVATESMAMAQDEAAAETLPVRANFGETAFFYPQVETNDKGEAILSFTLPESLTSWHFIGLAHDKNMRMGIIDTVVVAQKQLMVQPNMPRFLRVGDKATLTANVTNLSDKPQNVKVTLTINSKQSTGLRACSPEHLRSARNSKLTPGETLPVSFSLPEPKDTSSFVCTIVAKSDDFTDGEQHIIPILPIEQPTPSLTGEGRGGASSPSLGREGWGESLMEDLPALSIPASNNAITLSNALYANVLTAAIKDTIPSPANDNILVQLINLQHSDGSFSWYPGMPGNKYMTMAVLKTLTRMEEKQDSELARLSTHGAQETVNGKPSTVNSHQALATIRSKAFAFMLKAMSQEVSDMKKYKTTWLSNTALDWLYTLAIDPEAKGRKSDAYKYLLRLLEDETNKSDMATKSVAAIIMASNRELSARKEKTVNGKQYTVIRFVESIKQHTVYREDMGRYFDSYRTNYSWCDYRIPSHTMAIEALHAITPEDNCTIAEMQRWLVSCKRTQKWDNPVNTVNAVTAFQLPITPCPEETEKMYNQPTPEELENIIKVKREIIYPSVNRKQSTVNSKQPSALGPQPSDNGKLSTVNCKLSTKVIVRITIDADRDYDFVSVTDHRPACLEPVNQLSGYRWGYYSQMKDDRTEYFFDQLSKGTHVIETEYYVTRPGTYTTGPATAVCTYAPAYQGTTPAITVNVKP